MARIIINVKRNACNGLNAPKSKFAATNSIEPAKIKTLMNIG